MLKKTIIVTIIISIIMIGLVITSYGNKAITYREIKIKKGQTLWNIAKTYNQNEDPRKLVYQIKEINNIDNSILQPGQIIKVPVLQ